ncbi:MAG: acyl carrier protein [Pseudomonadales bacterium]
MHEEQIKQFILSDLIKDGSAADLSNDENLIDSGVVDSLGIMKLVAFLEKSFKVAVSDDEILLDNFETIDAISGFLSSKTS